MPGVGRSASRKVLHYPLPLPSDRTSSCDWQNICKPSLVEVNFVEKTSGTRKAERLIWAIFAIWIAFSIALLATAATIPDQATKDTFSSSCASCHGPSGRGDTAIGKSLHAPDLSSRAVQTQSNTQMHQAIADGKGNMPPFQSSLTPAQIDSLIAYIRTFPKPRK